MLFRSYLLWLTPFLFTPATRPLAVWTVTILPTYLALYLERVHGSWGLPWWLVAAEYGAVLAAAVVGLRFARQQQADAGRHALFVTTRRV